MDHNSAIDEVDVVEYVNHPLAFDKGRGADGLEDALVMEELRRRRGIFFGKPLQLFHIHGKIVTHPVFSHHDYRYEKHCAGEAVPLIKAGYPADRHPKHEICSFKTYERFRSWTNTLQQLFLSTTLSVLLYKKLNLGPLVDRGSFKTIYKITGHK